MIDQNATNLGDEDPEIPAMLWKTRDSMGPPGSPEGFSVGPELLGCEPWWFIPEWLSSSRGLVATGLLTYTWDEGSTANRSSLDWWNLQLTFSQPLGKPMVSSFPMAVPFHHPFSIRSPKGRPVRRVGASGRRMTTNIACWWSWETLKQRGARRRELEETGCLSRFLWVFQNFTEDVGDMQSHSKASIMSCLSFFCIKRFILNMYEVPSGNLT